MTINIELLKKRALEAKARQIEQSQEIILETIVIEPTQEQPQEHETPDHSVIDSRLKLMSYSSNCLLHSCPRKYQLTKTAAISEREHNVTLAFGTSFGEGLQMIVAGHSLDHAILKAFIKWPFQVDIFDSEPKTKKSFWRVLQALEMAADMVVSTGLDRYQIARFGVEQKEACELSFAIKINDFYYRGFVDAVLQDKITGQYVILEIKHTGANYTQEAKYKNSPQAIGYSVILDKIAPDIKEYKVIYLEYLTGLQKYEMLEFHKSYLQRAQWLRNIVIDTELVEKYSLCGDFPQHGESCVAFNRKCQFYDCCTMSDNYLLSPLVQVKEAIELDEHMANDYDVIVDIQELIQMQIDRGE